MAVKTLLTIGEQIDRAKDGRSQKWIVKKMNDADIEISEVEFSNCKNGHSKFTEKALAKLSEILGTEIIDNL